MSGGCWDYRDSCLCETIFGYRCDSAKDAAKYNPLQDRLISELVWDVFQLLHEYDWWESGDTGEEKYRKAVKDFKKKYLSKGNDLKRNIIDGAIEDAKNEIYEALGIEVDESETG